MRVQGKRSSRISRSGCGHRLTSSEVRAEPSSTFFSSVRARAPARAVVFCTVRCFLLSPPLPGFDRKKALRPGSRNGTVPGEIYTQQPEGERADGTTSVVHFPQEFAWAHTQPDVLREPGVLSAGFSLLYLSHSVAEEARIGSVGSCFAGGGSEMYCGKFCWSGHGAGAPRVACARLTARALLVCTQAVNE